MGNLSAMVWGAPLVVAAVGAGVWWLLLAAWPGARRPPAALVWAGPAGVLTVAAALALFGVDALGSAEGLTGLHRALVEVEGLLEVALLLQAGLGLVAGLCAFGAPLFALAALGRLRGERTRWSLGHGALVAPVALLAVGIAALAGVGAVAVALGGALGLILVACRAGSGEATRQAASARALVGSLGTGGLLALAGAHLVGQAQEGLLGAPSGWPGWAWATGDLGAVLGLTVAGTLGVLPVVRGLVNGPAAASAVLVVALGAVPTALIVPSILALQDYSLYDPEQAALELWARHGIEPVAVDRRAMGWAEGGLTVTTYWLWKDGERVAPYRGGVLDLSGTDDLFAFPAPLVVDRRADLRRIAPVLAPLGSFGLPVCVVALSPEGPTCVPVRLEDPDLAQVHLLLEPEQVVLIRGETPEPLDADELAEALRELVEPVAIHARPDVGAVRWVQTVALLGQLTGHPPIAVLDP